MRQLDSSSPDFFFTHPRASSRRLLAAMSMCIVLTALSACSGSNGTEQSASDSGQIKTTDLTDAGDTGGDNDADTGATTAGDADGNTDGGELQSRSMPLLRVPEQLEAVSGETIELPATITLQEIPLSVLVVNWQQTAGSGTAAFTNNSAAATAVSFDSDGEYELTLSVTNGTYTATEMVAVTVDSSSVNKPPVVDLIQNKTLSIDNTLKLAAVVSDDGLPNGQVSVSWSKVTGPGLVTFGELSQATTTATFSATGVYKIALLADDGLGQTRIEVQVIVTSPATVVDNEDIISSSRDWSVLTSVDGSKPQARHEAGSVAYQDKLYLLGGRGKRQFNRYDPDTDKWTNLGTPDFEFNHFQPVVFDNKIYVIGALACCFPRESVIAKIQIFNLATGKWSTGASIPQNRRRGSAGVVVYRNKIYIVGGSINGHDAGMVKWFDEYNPATNSWKTMPDAPTARDHFSAGIVGHRLVAAGGRQTDFPSTFKNLVSAVDVFNFSTGKWQSGKPIPTPRAGAVTVSHGGEVILMGGEVASGAQTSRAVEAYNVSKNSWRTLRPLKIGRHSGGGAVLSDGIHVVSGNTTTGGGAETQSHERLKFN